LLNGAMTAIVMVSSLGSVVGWRSAAENDVYREVDDRTGCLTVCSR